MPSGGRRGGRRPGAGRRLGSKGKLTPEQKIAKAIALERAIDELGITEKAVLQEIARIAFSDIRQVVSWRPEITTVEMPGEGEGAEPVPTKVLQSRVTVIDSAALTDIHAASIAEVAQTANGAIRVKMHDKGAALERLGRHLGLFKDRLEHTGKDGKPIQHEHGNAPDAAKVKDDLRAIFGGDLGAVEAPTKANRKHNVVRRGPRKGG